jgi:hypothetical protein
MTFRTACAVPLLITLSAVANAYPGSKRESNMVNAAKEFVASLTQDQKAKALMSFNSEERLNWFYIPKERQGLTYKSMQPAQRALATNLLKSSLSVKGYQKVETIRLLENVLRVLEAGKGPVRDQEMYYFTVFGEPSDSSTWGWRCEGHHVSLNWTIIKGKPIATSPQFLGSNPGEVRDGPMKGTRVLAMEEDLGRSLVKALTADQRKEGVTSEKAPADILTTNQRIAAIQEDTGIEYSKLSKEQQGLLLQLIKEHAGVQKPELAKERLEKIRHAGIDKVKFAWMGGLERGDPHYYRVQGSTFLIEYDNTQNNANHIHCVWRDFKGDWGLDLLAEHYKNSPHHHAGTQSDDHHHTHE